MPAPHRILAVANRTCPCPALLRTISGRAAEHDQAAVMVVAPALNSRLRHYLSDTDPALDEARARLELAESGLAELGVRAVTEVGDADPHVAIGDALARFPASEIIISTLPAGDSNWLERDLIERAREDFGVPVTHLVSHYGVTAPAPAR